jgi:hypothetical protein
LRTRCLTTDQEQQASEERYVREAAQLTIYCLSKSVSSSANSFFFASIG